MEVDQVINHMQTLDFDKLCYADVAEVLATLATKATEFDAKSKKIKAEKERIKEVVRERMLKEGSNSVNTECGTLAPKSSDHIVMNDFNQFKTWLRAGIIDDIICYLKKYELMTAEINQAIEQYACGGMPNDRLRYLKQSCFNSKELKELHVNKEASLPPGIGIYVKKELSITKMKVPE